jgi:thioredoxin reductase (NADPH)
METEKLVIIGSGPAGYTAAIYAARAELKPLIIEGKEPGGQLMGTTDVENWPGYPDGILGPDMINLFKKQAERFGTRMIGDQVIEADFSSNPFVLKTSDQTIMAEAVIISTGASAKWLNIPGEEEYKGRGVSACATCDGFFFKEKQVIVIGGGDAAMEEATFLTKFATKVNVLVRKDDLRASKIMQKRAIDNEKVEIHFNTELLEIVGDGNKVTSVKMHNNKNNEDNTMDTDGVFVSIGHRPNTDIFSKHIDLDHIGYIKTESGSTRTNMEGVFAAGDVADHVYRQAITAAGTGCMAALDAEKWLAGKE